MFVECRHIMPTGRKCHSPALRGKAFCFFHARLHFRRPAAASPGKLPHTGIEDLHTAVARVLTALASPLTDPRRAGVLLYGLNIAAGLSKHTAAPEPPARAATSSATPELLYPDAKEV